jgi:hypothetical protein
MKKCLLLISVSILSLATIAQNEKYVKAMESLVPAVDTTRSREGLSGLANSFERIANVEKTQWLPFYYAALTTVSSAYTLSDGSFGDKSTTIDPLADKAEGFINKAESLSKDNSEIWIVKKMLATLRLMANPMARYMEFGPIAEAALGTARKLNPENPRTDLLEAQDLYFTPEQFGGDKQKAKVLFETAIRKYGAFKPESSIHPTWGLGQAKYFLSEIK